MRLSIPKVLSQGGKGKYLRNSGFHYATAVKERELSGERNDLNNY